MTKQEFLAKLQENKEVKKAEDTIVPATVVDEVKPAEGIKVEETPVQAEIEKEVAAAVEPVVDADAEGVSENGGEAELTDDSVEAERKKEDNAAKDVINVTDRTYEEQVEVNNELVRKLAESEEKIASLTEQVAKINAMTKDALQTQKEQITEAFAKKLTAVLEQISAEGTALEESLQAEANKAKASLALAEAYGKASLKLNNILIKRMKESRVEKKMVCCESYKARISNRAKRFGC